MGSQGGGWGNSCGEAGGGRQPAMRSMCAQAMLCSSVERWQQYSQKAGDSEVAERHLAQSFRQTEPRNERTWRHNPVCPSSTFENHRVRLTGLGKKNPPPTSSSISDTRSQYADHGCQDRLATWGGGRGGAGGGPAPFPHGEPEVKHLLVGKGATPNSSFSLSVMLAAQLESC